MSTLTRRDFIKGISLAAAALAAPGLPGRAAAAEGKRPNIIFILADDLGYGDLGCYGQKNIKTPNLDKMAAEGVRFTDAYAGTTVCAPSRCSLMTGMDMGHAFVRGNAGQSLRPEDVTIPMVLKQAGYATGLVGKWGLGEEGTEGVPTKKGFDYFFGYLNQKHAHNYYPDYLHRNEEKVSLDNVLSEDEPLVARVKKTWSHDLMAKEALEFVEKHKDGPFFLYLAFTLPHANNEGSRKNGNGMEVPSLGEYADKPWPAPEKGRAAMVTRMDKDIGELFAKLKALGIDDNTIVFFTSDNGPHKEGGEGCDPEFHSDNGPLRGIKRDLYEGGIRVPMIARWPGRIKAGAESKQVWAFWDFAPTAAELAGTTFPGEIQGISMVPAILGTGEQKQHEYLYWEFYEGGFKSALRVGDMKAVRKGIEGPIELYDLSRDIGETTDIAAQHPAVIEKMKVLFKRAHVDSEKWNLATANVPKQDTVFPKAGAQAGKNGQKKNKGGQKKKKKAAAK